MKYIMAAVLLILGLLFHAEGAVQNCTAAPCDLATCSNTSSSCEQYCSAAPCNTSCTSPAGCRAECINGGCLKMSCVIAESLGKGCFQTCKKDCANMTCKSKLCYPKCLGDNCTMSCFSSVLYGQCYPRCMGKNCNINCLSTNCEANCVGGQCTIKFSKHSNGVAFCAGGGCKLICAKGKHCDYQNPCANCTKEVVSDPFAAASGVSITMPFHVALFCLVSASLSQLL